LRQGEELEERASCDKEKSSKKELLATRRRARRKSFLRQGEELEEDPLP